MEENYTFVLVNNQHYFSGNVFVNYEYATYFNKSVYM